MSKNVVILDCGTVFSNTDRIFGYNAFPSVARDNTGCILAAWTGGRIMHVCPFGKVLISKSKDEGKHWSSPVIAVDTPLDDRDAGILNLGNRKLLVSTFNNTRELQHSWMSDSNAELDAKYFRSTDSLRNLASAYLHTLNDEQENTFVGSLISISENDGFSWSEPYKVPVTAPHGPNLLHDGSLIYAGTPYYSDDPEESGYPIVIYKSNNYKKFYKTAKIPVNPEKPNLLYSEPHIIELPSGRIILHIRVDELQKKYEDRLFSIYQSISDDGGVSWSIPMPTGASGAPPQLLHHSSGTLICSYSRRLPLYGIQTMFSTNQGNTWDTDYFVWDKGQNIDLGYPSTIELDGGDLFTVFYAMRPGEEQCSILWTRWKLPALV